MTTQRSESGYSKLRAACRLSLLFAACLLLWGLPLLAAPAQEVPPVNWLVVPVTDLSQEAPPGLPQAIDASLLERLHAVEGWTARRHDAAAPHIANAVATGALTTAEATRAPDLASARRLGRLWDADTVLIGLLVLRDEDLILHLNAVGTYGRATAGPHKALDIPSAQVEIEPGQSLEAAAAALTEGIAERLAALASENPLLWSRDAQSVPEWIAEGDSYMLEGRFRFAREAYQTALFLQADNIIARRKAAEALLARGEAAAARDELEAALQAAPEDVDLLLSLGEAYLALGEAGRAAGHFRQAALFSQDDLRPKHGLARADTARGNLRPALAAFEELVQAMPDNALLHADYAAALNKAGAAMKAIDEYYLALTLDPGNLPVRSSLAQTLLENRRLGEGIHQLRLLSDAAGTLAPYPAGDYRRMMRLFFREFEAVVRETDAGLEAYEKGEVPWEALAETADFLHMRTDNLAQVMERLAPPQDAAKSHDYWVLAANLLNHANFELLRYARGEDYEFRRRFVLFRNAAREAAIKAADASRAERSGESPSPSSLPP